MTRTSPPSYVLRDTGTSVVFWLVAAVGAVIAGDSAFRGDPLRFALTTAIAALVVWVVGMVLFHPHVRYNDERVVVTNIGRIHEMPWSRVVTARQGLSLTFELDDGRRILASGVTAPRDRGLVLGTLTRGKLGAGSADFHKYADAIRLLQDNAAANDNRVVSRWDSRALAIGGVLALVVAVLAVIAATAA